jgi:NitT/TauT family transport system substrate-binding protein
MDNLLPDNIEEMLKTWREINADPASIAVLREKYNVLPDIEQIEVDEMVPSFTQGVEIDLYPNNGGSAEAVKEDFVFYTTAGSLEGDPETLKVEDYWYLDPVNKALETLGTM